MHKNIKIARINFNTRKKNVNQLPILYVRFSNKHTYTQLIHDGKIIFDVSSLNQKVFDDIIKPYNVAGAKVIGEIVGQKINERGFNNYVLNRGTKVYLKVVKNKKKNEELHRGSWALTTLNTAVRETLGGLKK